ncbi:MAG: 4'-phosphopantetheinyl transferase superfamily protein [Chloroflexi bacterium]|nr:4'-phosphopantetheinyl transferase superfamily protein [Chloroflexota bacterium]
MSYAWQRPPNQLTLEPNQIHVWRITLDSSARADDLSALLSRDERARAQAFHFPEHRARFIVAHASVRLILARYTRIAPPDLAFATDVFGKPELIQPTPVLRFNLAHSENLALCAITAHAPIGVDVEFIKPLENRADIAARFFSPREVAALRALPAHQHTRGFFNCWTRKEAYIKAIGKGLSQPLDEFDVTLAPGEPARLLFARDDPFASERWSLFALEPAPGYVGAIAIQARERELRCWRFE